jgi:hypothetical protein
MNWKEYIYSIMPSKATNDSVCSDVPVASQRTVSGTGNVVSVLVAMVSIIALLIIRRFAKYPGDKGLLAERIDYTKFPFGRSDSLDIDVVHTKSMSCRPSICSEMFTGHLKGGFPVEDRLSLVVYGEKGVGKTLLRQCVIDGEHRLLVELTSTDEFEALLWTHQSTLGWKDVWLVVFTKTASALADFASTRTAMQEMSNNNLTVKDHLETFNLLFYLAQSLSIGSARDSLLKFFAQHLFGQAVPATEEGTDELLVWIRTQLDVDRDPPPLSQLSEYEAERLLAFTAKFVDTVLKLTLTIVVDGLDEIGTDLLPEGGPRATIAAQLKTRLIDHLLMHFVEMAARKHLSIMYFLPKIVVSDFAKRRIVDSHQLDSLRPMELKWTTVHIWAAARERYDKWIVQLEAAHRQNREPIPAYPTFDAFLHLHNKNLCRRLAFVSHSPEEFFSFLNTLSKHVESRLPTPHEISDVICLSLCSTLDADGQCRPEGSPSFCRVHLSATDWTICLLKFMVYVTLTVLGLVVIERVVCYPRGVELGVIAVLQASYEAYRRM